MTPLGVVERCLYRGAVAPQGNSSLDSSPMAGGFIPRCMRKVG